MVEVRLGLGLGSGLSIRIMLNFIRLWDWAIMVIFRWGHSDRGHFDLVPGGHNNYSTSFTKNSTSRNIIILGNDAKNR